MIDWNANRGEWKLAAKIAARAVEMGIYSENQFATAEMDIIACHKVGCELNLAALLVTEASEFRHDVAGIKGRINRETGELPGLFVPRFAEQDFQHSDAE